MNKPAILPQPDKVAPVGIEGLSRLRIATSAGRPIVRIHLLGSMRATSYLGDNVLPRGKKARAILGCLCLMSGERVPRARLASMLWDRVPDEQARTSFRQALRELSAAFGDLAGELISADRDTVKFNLDLCWIDAVALLTRDQSQPSALRSDLASLCAGELLEDSTGSSASFDHWLFGERSRFTDQLRALLETELHELTRRSGDGKHIAEVARRLIAFDATHEGATRILMRALADIGERAQALREFARCREALKNTLDVEPSPETQALFEAIRTRPDRNRGERAANPSAFELQGPQPAPRGRNRLRVGVLPLIGSRSRNEENLGFSLSQEIAAALARFRWFDVIAPVSLMHKPSPSSVSEALLRHKDLDFVVDGAISGNGKEYQISVRLLDLTQYARPVWSDRFELAVGQLHRLNELVTGLIVGRIDPVILFIEGQPKRREQYGATGLVLLAMPLIYSAEREKFEEAGRLIHRALAIDPDNAMVAAWAAFWQVFYVGQGWCEDVDRAFAAAQDHALRAVRLDPDNAEALGIYAHVCAFLNKDLDTAIHYFDRALRLNPNLALVWALSAPTYCYIGDPEESLRRLDRYRDLAPFDPYFSWFENFYTMAYNFKGDYEKAAAVGRRSVKVTPRFSAAYKHLIAALGHLGRRDEARQYIETLLALEPNFTVRRFGEVYPFKHARDRNRYMAGLRKAGVPEK
jgi:DNA-binding SARP family transcriptional activator